MSAEGMVARFASVIPGYVQKNYGWLRERHCLYDVDDLIQVAMIELMQLSKTWEPRPGLTTRKARNMMFFYDLKYKVASAIKEHRKKVEPGKFLEDSFDRGYDESGESVLLPRLSMHQRSDTPEGKVTIGNVIDHFNLLPSGRKVTLALRFYDELSYRQIGELIERDEHTVATEASRSMAMLRDFARNQFTDHAVDVHSFRPQAWEPGETLTSYVQGRHRMDVYEFIGCFVLAMRADPVMLARMLDTAAVHVSGGNASRIRTDLQQMVDARLAAGMSQAAIARELELPRTTVWNYAHRESGSLS